MPNSIFLWEQLVCSIMQKLNISQFVFWPHSYHKYWRSEFEFLLQKLHSAPLNDTATGSTLKKKIKKIVSVPSHSHPETDFTHVLPNSNNLNSLFNKRPVSENEDRWHSRVFKMLLWKHSHSLLLIQDRFRRLSWNVYDKFISCSGIGPHALDSTCSGKKKKKSVTYGALMYCFSSSLSTSAYPMSPVMNLFRKKKKRRMTSQR